MISKVARSIKLGLMINVCEEQSQLPNIDKSWGWCTGNFHLLKTYCRTSLAVLTASGARGEGMYCHCHKNRLH